MVPVTLQSFNDLERGVSPSTRTAQSPKDTQFLNLQLSLALQVFKINSDVKGILKFVDQLGTSWDTGLVRKGLSVVERKWSSSMPYAELYTSG